MKLNSFFISLLVASLSFTFVTASPIAKCSDQVGCFEFTQEDVTATSTCRPGASCVAKICFQYTNQAGCNKAGAAISHMCDSGDANSCLRTTPSTLFDGSGESTCGLDASTETDKCGSVSEDTIFCQEASPGETVYFVVKDGNANTPDTYEDLGDGGMNDPVIKCGVASSVGVGNCGNVSAQASKEMVWSYQIPMNVCDSYCPAGYTLTTVGFDQSKDGTTVYQHGDYVSDLGFGFKLRVRPAAGGKNVKIPRIYDSDITGGADPDLEQGLGNVLIIQEEVTPDVPNDTEAGGTMILYFSEPTKIKSLGLLDTEVRTKLSFVKWSGPPRTRIWVDPIPDATSTVVEVDQDDVKTLRIATDTSFAVSFVELCVKD